MIYTQISECGTYGFKPHDPEQPEAGGELWAWIQSMTTQTMVGYVMHAENFDLAIDTHEEEMACLLFHEAQDEDRYGNKIMTHGCDRCECGGKYWVKDICVCCGYDALEVKEGA